ncbi:hypothetical protein WR25_21359 [Diploscapter pachys]|uniref:Uncharacterized protein n=1 Tax=Diploscapter pachys TaxID=2018661 RepID=A0A2A2KGR9_9BILA|nr:hypothetical protein WR25_21359 [Diploscapter pachys]
MVRGTPRVATLSATAVGGRFGATLTVTLAGARLGEVGDAQRHVAVRVAVVGQQIEGDRYADTGTGAVGLGYGGLVFGLYRSIADHHHRLHVETAVSRLDRDAGRWLGQVVDRETLLDSGLGHPPETLDQQVRHCDFVAGTGLDQQLLGVPVIARRAHLDHIAELA